MKKHLYAAILFCCVFACVKDHDYDIPEVSVSEPQIPENQITTFRAIRSLYEQAVAAGKTHATIEGETDLYITGYVISTDQYGNFFRELFVQNKTDATASDEDPRLGFKIAINVRNLSETYQFGQKVYIKLNGLTLGNDSGVITLGRGDGEQLQDIQPATYKDIIIRSNEIATITPKVIDLRTVTAFDQSTLIKLEGMQLTRFEKGASFASESTDQFNGFRVMESCESGVNINLQTSTFADFKSLIVPQEKFDVTGVLSRDFRDDFDTLIINNTQAIVETDDPRCDPLEFACGLADAVGTNNLFAEDFESQRNNKPITDQGWTNYIEAGSESWEAFSSASSNASLGRSARFKSASSGDPSNIGWLITPAIDLDAQDNETLTFKTSNSKADGSYLEVLYSLDWDGTEAGIETATWGELSAAYVVKDTDSFAPWFSSGIVDLSCVSGTIHIAFKYTGSGQTAFDGVYELDEISVDYND